MSGDVVAQLHEAVGDAVVTAPSVVSELSHDRWIRAEIARAVGPPSPLPLCVVRPRDTREVQTVVRVCALAGVSVVARGLGSGVCGGVLAGEASIVVDLASMNRVRRIDEWDLVAEIDAGACGRDAELAVNERGLTLGHFPQSMDLSSVGGWVATRASGQFSTGYGNIEDLVLGLEVVLPSGDVVRTSTAPRSSTGPDLKHLFLGSEGTLGIVTAVTFSLHRVPEARRLAAFSLTDMAAGFELQRALLQAGWAPAVLRQYDATEAARLFTGAVSQGRALLLLVSEGPVGRTLAEIARSRELALECGATPISEGVVERWLEERNHVPRVADYLKQGIAVDTIEVAAPWSKINDLYDGVLDALRGQEGILNASGHSSHAYRSGTNLYLTFAAKAPSKEEMLGVYDECWQRVMAATLSAGGTISHHHGIGRVRRSHLAEELGPEGIALLRRIKAALDPASIMNPGVLLPDPVVSGD